MATSQTRSSKRTAGRREAGQILVVAVLLIPVALAFAGLGLDVAMLMLGRTNYQRVADAAVIAGSQAWLEDGQSAAEPSAREYATKNGYTDGMDNTEVDVEILLKEEGGACGIPAEPADCLKVTVTHTSPTLFLRLLGLDDATSSATAVGKVTTSPAPYALIVLNNTACRAYDHSGTGDLILDGGGAIVNSDGSEDGCDGVTAEQSGGAIVTADHCYTTDDPPEEIDCKLDHLAGTAWSYPDGQASPSPTTVGHPIDDPLAGLTRPVPCNKFGAPNGCIPASPDSGGSASNCKLQHITDKNIVLHPGTYYGGLRIDGNSNVTFEPGLYVFAGGGFGWNGQTGDATAGVTFFNTSAPSCNGTKGDCSGFNLQASGVLTVIAPADQGTKGPFDDNPVDSGDLNDGVETVAFWQADSCSTLDCTDATAFSYAGTANTVTGIIYLPTACLKMSGGGSLGAVQIIVDKFKYSGSSNTTIDYENYIDIQRPGWALVE